VLRQRILAALVLIPLVVWVVLWAPPPVFAVASALVLLGGVWEWTRLVPLAGLAPRLAFVLVFAGLLALGWLRLAQPDWAPGLLVLALAWWLLALAWILRPLAGQRQRGLKALLALLVLPPAWVGLNLLHAAPQGPAWLMFLLVLIWVADSGAYFAGRAFGRHKLAPRVSPGKTWEGVAGGLLACALVGWLGGGWLGDATLNRPGLVLLAVATGAISVVGDLFISLLKRQVGLKDTGHLIPGHGGVLDRIDSLLAATPAFVLGLEQVHG